MYQKTLLCLSVDIRNRAQTILYLCYFSDLQPKKKKFTNKPTHVIISTSMANNSLLRMV